MAGQGLRPEVVADDDKVTVSGVQFKKLLALHVAALTILFRDHNPDCEKFGAVVRKGALCECQRAELMRAMGATEDA